MLSRKNKLFLLKLASLFSVVRGHNIAIIVLAQYLASFYIFAPEKTLYQVLFDPYLFLIVLASALSIASGYIINNFYDAEKDLINRPHKTILDSYVSQKTKLSTYFVLNFIVVILASAVSFRAVAFFSVYIFLLWFYSHKLKKIPLIGNMTAASLAVIPFFGIFIYYKNFDWIIFVHATFLFLILLIRELTKDMENLKGDFAQNYRTIPVVYGNKTSKVLISIAFLLTSIPVYFLLSDRVEVGYMFYYFMLSFGLLALFLILLWQSKSQLHYKLLHLLLRLILVLGVLSILLIDVEGLMRRFF